jgi:hypothetical protein
MDCEEQAKLLVWELEDSDTSVLPMTLETAELERRRDLLLARGRELRAALVELDVEVLPEPHPDLDAAYAAFQSERASKAEQRGRTRGNG